MEEGNNKSSFERLVAGLSNEDRLAMLNKINQNSEQEIHLSESIESIQESHTTLQAKLQKESVFYKIVLWIRALFAKSSMDQLYHEDVLAEIARRINRAHPGLLNHKIKIVDYIFYERLQHLKEAADFFKPYLIVLDENPGDFYVFVGSFSAPDLTDKINETVDPFSINLPYDVSQETRNELLRKLDDILMNMNPGTRTKIYNSISAINWLKCFVSIPYLHFLSQFTNISSDMYTCPYKNARVDYNILASVFANTIPVDNEMLEALFLYSQKKILNDSVMEKNLEKAVKDFMDKALSHFNAIQSFINGVPVTSMGRVINASYDWSPENINGAEGWFPSFRMQWKKLIDIRWSEWLREQKKQNLTEAMRRDFGLSDFPVMAYRPWLKLWSSIRFSCDLTGGFLSWFATEKYDKVILPLNDLAMEGIFFKGENRVEYSEGLNNFSTANTRMLGLIESLSSKGEIGMMFEEFSTSKVHTFQVQKQIDGTMEQIEKTVRDCLKLFGKGARTIDRVFHGIFDEDRDGIHDSLQNLSSIKGHDNRHFRDSLIEIRKLLQRCVYYLTELEPIDNSVTD